MEQSLIDQNNIKVKNEDEPLVNQFSLIDMKPEENFLI